MIKKFQEDRDVFLFCDFHGHSRRKNVFMYGCSSNKAGDFNKEKIFPKLLSMNSKIFSFPSCCFDIQKSKESTGRVVVWRELNIMNSYTIEASFCGADFERYADCHFNRQMLEELGHQFCEAIYDFCDPDQTKFKKAMKELEIAYLEKEAGSEGSNENSDWDSGSSEEENYQAKEDRKKAQRKGKAKEGSSAPEDPSESSPKKGQSK